MEIVIGHNAGHKSIKLNNCTFIGINAGRDILEGENITIIGDNITSLRKDQADVFFMGDKIAIGNTLFGEHLNLHDILIKYLKKINNGRNS